jgi:hypothetical protein
LILKRAFTSCETYYTWIIGATIPTAFIVGFAVEKNQKVKNTLKLKEVGFRW